jgi:hypothetical protein
LDKPLFEKKNKHEKVPEKRKGRKSAKKVAKAITRFADVGSSGFLVTTRKSRLFFVSAWCRNDWV